MSSHFLRALIEFSRDGEWGKEEPFQNAVRMRVIRGTDFESVGSGDLRAAPVRYISERSAARKALRSGDILIETAGGSKTRPTGRTMLVTRRLIDKSDLPLTCASFARFIRINEELADPGFVFWYLQNLYKQGEMAKHQVQHTGVARFQFTRFAESTTIQIPDRTSQKWIAATLGSLDNKIEINRKMNRTLEEIAQTLFRAWFVDFEGETALVESEQGPLPRGWSVAPIVELVETVGGGTPSTKEPEYWEGGEIHWTTPRDLSGLESPVLLDTARKISEAGLEKISSGLLPEGTVLLSSRAPVGYTAIAQIPLAVNQGYIAIPPGGRLSSFYVLFWLRENLDRIKGRAGGTTFQEISKKNFRPMLAIEPPKEAQELFDNIVAPLFERIVLNERQSRTLADLRDTLLPKLISGEIRVPEAEEALEEAV